MLVGVGDGSDDVQYEVSADGMLHPTGRLTVLASMVMACRARRRPIIVEFELILMEAYAFIVPTKYELVFNVAELPTNQ
jgi:hypothetical protein